MRARDLRRALNNVPDDADVVVVYDEGQNDAGCYDVIAAREGSGGSGPSSSCFFIVLEG